MLFKKLYKQFKKDQKFRKTLREFDTTLFPIEFFEDNKISFPSEENPLVSIIIPIHNQLKYTLNCLYSIMQIEDGIAKEIIIIDDKSTDQSLTFLKNITGITIIENKENIGFLKSVNKGIEKANSEFIYLLNNDTKVLPQYLSSLLEVFKNNKDAGAVGSKLIFADGTLQEAGCLLFNNEVAVNRGAAQSVDDPKFNYLKKVDYCSGCSLLFRRVDREQKLNLLAEIYSPAYYEETDLCMRLIHDQGLTVYYQPQSEIIHFENISYQNKAQNKTKLIQKNHRIFWDQWKSKVLNNQWIGSSDKKVLNDHVDYEKIVLLVEEYVPKYDQDSGSNRFTEIVKILVNNKCKVYLLVKNIHVDDDHTYISLFESMGVEVIREYLSTKGEITRVEKQIDSIYQTIDYIWVFRPEGYEYYSNFLRKADCKAKIIYDMVDLHFLRFTRETDFIEKSKDKLKRENEVKELEQKALKEADFVVAISDKEKDIIIDLGIDKEKVFIVSNIHSVKENITQPNFKDRNDLIFIGGFHHQPNVDAVLYLNKEIMPLVWEKNENIKVKIIGGSLPEEIKALHTDRFQILGYQKDIDHYFLSAKAFVAPLRYGAGVKGKIGQALEYKLPVISTTIGVEGMMLKPDINVLVAETDDAQNFANHILQIYEDEQLWKKLHHNSEEGLDYFSVKKQEENIIELLQF